MKEIGDRKMRGMKEIGDRQMRSMKEIGRPFKLDFLP